MTQEEEIEKQKKEQEEIIKRLDESPKPIHIRESNVTRTLNEREKIEDKDEKVSFFQANPEETEIKRGEIGKGTEILSKNPIGTKTAREKIERG